MSTSILNLLINNIFKSYVENVQFRGLKATNENYLKANMQSDIFKATNFEEILERTDKIRRKLLTLGCFKSVEAFVDASSNL